jgi:hypothetical protein
MTKGEVALQARYQGTRMIHEKTGQSKGTETQDFITPLKMVDNNNNKKTL